MAALTISFYLEASAKVRLAIPQLDEVACWKGRFISKGFDNFVAENEGTCARVSQSSAGKAILD